MYDSPSIGKGPRNENNTCVIRHLGCCLRTYAAPKSTAKIPIIVRLDTFLTPKLPTAAAGCGFNRSMQHTHLVFRPIDATRLVEWSAGIRNSNVLLGFDPNRYSANHNYLSRSYAVLQAIRPSTIGGRSGRGSAVCKYHSVGTELCGLLPEFQERGVKTILFARTSVG